MKKTESISIAGTHFHIEEDAYHALRTYLESVRAHFADNTDRNEIMADIESRIAELFNAKEGKVINHSDVHEVITSMGKVEDFGDEPTESKPAEGFRRKFYRNPDNRVIAGVASGISSYFGINTTIVRVIFLLSIFFGGTGVFVYLLLWVFVPEAKTAAQRLQMRGEPVTLGSMADAVNARIDEIGGKGNTLERIFRVPFKIINKMFIALSERIFPALLRLLGVLVTLFSGLAVLALTTALAATIMNNPLPHVDYILAGIVTGGRFAVFALSLYISLVIPAFFALLLGISIFRRKNTFDRKSAYLAGVWFVGVVIFGAMFAGIVVDYNTRLENDPAYQAAEKHLDETAFDSVAVYDGAHVVLEDGQNGVSIEGMPEQIDSMSLSVEEGVLVVRRAERNENEPRCLFCGHEETVIHIGENTLSSIMVDDGYVEGSLTASSTLVTVKKGYANLDINSASSSIAIERGNVSLEGNVGTLEASLGKYASLQASDLKAGTAILTLEDGAEAFVDVRNNLNVIANGSSMVTYEGNPVVEKQLGKDARVIGPDGIENES